MTKETLPKEIEDKIEEASEASVANWVYNKVSAFIIHEKRKAFKEGAIFGYSLRESKGCEDVFEFAQWASSSDWVYLPSKKLWYNEEDEENITPKTTEQLYSQFAKEPQNPTSQLDELKKEVERRNKLIKQLYVMYNREVMFPDKLEQHFQQFATENNL